MNNLKKIAKMIEKELGHTNGWKIPDEEYSAKCHLLASKIVSQMQPQVKPANGGLKEELRKIIFSDEFGWVDNHEWMMDGNESTEILWNWFVNNASRLSV